MCVLEWFQQQKVRINVTICISNTGSQELAFFTLKGLSLTHFHYFLEVSANTY